MKKRYIKPESEIVEFSLMHICNASPIPGLDTGGDDKTGDDEITEVGAARGDWDNIWNN